MTVTKNSYFGTAVMVKPRGFRLGAFGRRYLFLASSLCISLNAQADTSVVPSIRGVQLGVPCDAVKSAESKLGSIAHPTSGGVFLAFDGTESGRKAFMLYTCHSGVVDQQLITMEVSDEETAYVTGQQIEKELQAALGEPKLDLISPTLAAFFKRLWLRFEFRDVLAEHDPLLHSALWELGEVNVFIHIGSDRQHLYQVSISQDKTRHLFPSGK